MPKNSASGPAKTAQMNPSGQTNPAKQNQSPPAYRIQFFVNSPNAANNRTEAKNGSNSSTEEQIQSIPDVALCKTRVSDLALIFFTYCLVVVGWLTISASNSNMRAVERARIYTGVITDGILVTNDGRTRAPLGLTNQGKTAGTIKRIACGFTLTEPAGDATDYSAAETVAKNSAVPPGFASATQQAVHVFFSAHTAAHYCFGYVEYDDIWGVTHTSRFCNKIDPQRRTQEPAGSAVWSNDD